MAQNIRRIARKPAGRPLIQDEAQLLVFMELARRKMSKSLGRCVSVRELTSRHRLRFDGRLEHNQFSEPLRPLIRGEALRRRHNRARASLIVPALPPGLSCELHNKLRAETEGLFETIITGLSD